MNQLKTILVGVDFSECSRCALEQAVRLARWNNAGLNVIHVMDSSALDDSLTRLPPELDELRRINREHAIGRLADWTKEAGAPDGHSREVMNGVPLDVLLQESRTRRVDLLVLGITGDSLLPYGAGTLATKCLRKSATKVLLVKQTHPRPFRRIVACVDFSETSNEVVKQALRVAGQDQAELHFLHVFQAEWNNWSSRAKLSALADFEQKLPGDSGKQPAPVRCRAARTPRDLLGHASQDARPRYRRVLPERGRGPRRARHPRADHPEIHPAWLNRRAPAEGNSLFHAGGAFTRGFR